MFNNAVMLLGEHEAGRSVRTVFLMRSVLRNEDLRGLGDLAMTERNQCEPDRKKGVERQSKRYISRAKYISRGCDRCGDDDCCWLLREPPLAG